MHFYNPEWKACQSMCRCSSWFSGFNTDHTLLYNITWIQFFWNNFYQTVSLQILFNCINLVSDLFITFSYFSQKWYSILFTKPWVVCVFYYMLLCYSLQRKSRWMISTLANTQWMCVPWHTALSWVHTQATFELTEWKLRSQVILQNNSYKCQLGWVYFIMSTHQLHLL